MIRRSSVLRLLLGLGAVFFLGYALLTLLVPRPRDFTCLERAAFSFGVGALALTFWMLALTWAGPPFSLAWILGPPLALAVVLLLAPRGRRALREDARRLQVRPRLALAGLGLALPGAPGAGLSLCPAPGRPLPHVGLGCRGHLGLQGQDLLCQPGPGPDLH